MCSSARRVDREALGIVVHAEGEHAVIGLSGEIDASTAPGLRTSLDAVLRTRRHVVLDFSGVAFFGSTGWRVIVDAAERAAAADGGLEIVGVHAPAARVFELCDPTGAAPVSLSPDATPRAPSGRD